MLATGRNGPPLGRGPLRLDGSCRPVGGAVDLSLSANGRPVVHLRLAEPGVRRFLYGGLEVTGGSKPGLVSYDDVYLYTSP